MGIDEVEFIVGTFQTFIPGLQSDKWDVVVSGLTITEERQEQVDFHACSGLTVASMAEIPGLVSS